MRQTIPIRSHWELRAQPPCCIRQCIRLQPEPQSPIIHDAPYAELTHAFASLDLHGLRVRSAVNLPATAAPPAASDALESWDLTRAFVEPSLRNPRADAFADLYVAWRPEALLVGLATSDFADRELYAGRVVAPESRFRVRVTPADGTSSTVASGPHARLGNAMPSGARSGGCRNTRCTAVIAIPTARLAPAGLAQRRSRAAARRHRCRPHLPRTTDGVEARGDAGAALNRDVTSTAVA